LAEHGARRDMELTKILSGRELLRLDLTSMALPSDTSADEMICFGYFLSMAWDEMF
jgi:hypothetical protein